LGIRNEFWVLEMGFEALETSYGALESSFEADFGRSWAGSKSGLAKPTVGVGLARTPAGVGPGPRR
jgi:hypothetical protein